LVKLFIDEGGQLAMSSFNTSLYMKTETDDEDEIFSSLFDANRTYPHIAKCYSMAVLTGIATCAYARIDILQQITSQEWEICCLLGLASALMDVKIQNNKSEDDDDEDFSLLDIIGSVADIASWFD
jgi:hypothetical protein